MHLISVRLEHLLAHTLAQNHQAILLLNRRGYSNFVYCRSCNEALQCKYCDTTMTYHRTAGVHLEKPTTAEGVHTGPTALPLLPGGESAAGDLPGVQQKAELVWPGHAARRGRDCAQIPRSEIRPRRQRFDARQRDYEKTLGQFARREIQVMLGTQMIAKGLDYPNVTLVGVISGDTALALPDFRAAERTFQLITQVAGRAGRGDAPGRVVLQTFLPDDPTILAAIKQDYAGFAQSELKHRREVGLPPFTRMVRIILRDQESEKLTKLAEELAALFTAAIAKARSRGADERARCPARSAASRAISGIRSCSAADRASSLAKVLADVREKGGLAKSDRIAVDVDPVSLL